VVRGRDVIVSAGVDQESWWRGGGTKRRGSNATQHENTSADGASGEGKKLTMTSQYRTEQEPSSNHHIRPTAP
jgi:hypothetical protein